MFDKITEQEVNNAYVQSAPDKLTGSTQENKSIFDRLPLLIIDKFNDFITAITGQGGASDIGAEAIKEGGATNVQGVLGELAEDINTLAQGKVDAEEGKGLSSLDFTEELKRIYDTASERAEVIKDIEAITDTVSQDDNKLPTSNAVYQAIDEKVSEIGAGDMQKSVYDTNNNGIVDNAERLGGELPEYYASANDVDSFKEEVGEAFENVSSTKVVEGITVLSTAWVDETETTALWRCRIENAEIIENTIVNVHFDITDYTDETASSLVRATNAGVLAVTTSGVGYVDVYATSQPDSDLLCSLELTGYRVVE